MSFDTLGAQTEEYFKHVLWDLKSKDDKKLSITMKENFSCV